MIKIELARAVDELDPTGPEFQAVAEAVSRKTAALRQASGRLPYDLFLSTVEMMGLSPVLELLITDQEGGLYVKRRAQDENATAVEASDWGGLLHLPGTTIFPNRRFEMNLYSLLAREVVGGEDAEKAKALAHLYRTAEVVGVGVHDEPARKTNGLKIYVRAVVSGPDVLQSGFEIVDGRNFEQVIHDHKGVIRRILKHRGGPLVFDVRG